MIGSDDNSYYEKFADGRVVCIDDDIPFEIPQSWEWARMQSVLTFINGRAFKKEELHDSGKYKVLRVGNFFTNETWYYSNLELQEEKYCFDGDLLYAWSASFGPRIWRGGKTIFHYHIWNVKFSRTNILREYLLYYLEYDKTQIRKSTTGSTMIHVSMENMNPRFIPIPPYNEQIRIVEKIEELLPMISHYGQLEVSLGKLNYDIKEQLRKSVLQEAIQGHLVPQEQSDEPASILLENIQAEKKKLLKEGIIKKTDARDSIIYKGDNNKYYETISGESTEIELPYPFQESWAIVRLRNICSLLDGEKRVGDGICLDAKYLRGKSSGDHLQSGKFVHKGDNIILVDGENSGEVFTAPIDGYMGSTFKQLWISDSLYIPYVIDCLRFYKDELRNTKKGAAIPHLNKEIFKSIIIGIPPYNEQYRIEERLKDLNANL